jgi:hypothetical protein
MGAVVNLARTGAPAQTDYNGFVRNTHEITQKAPTQNTLNTNKTGNDEHTLFITDLIHVC